MRQGTYGIAADVAVCGKGHMGLQQTLRFGARDLWDCSRLCGLRRGICGMRGLNKKRQKICQIAVDQGQNRLGKIGLVTEGVRLGASPNQLVTGVH